MIQDKKILNIVGVIILSISMLAVGFTLGKVTKSSSSVTSFHTSLSNLFNPLGYEADDTPANIDMSLFWQVWNTLSQEYVDEDKVDYEKMYYGAIKGLVNSYDDYATIFYDPEETQSFNESNEGKLFAGIGAELGYQDGSIIVVTPLKGSPAEEAGLQSGDIILKVDGVEISTSETIYDVVTRIRGDAGTTVILTIYAKNSSEIKDVPIVRQEITIPSITVEKASDIDSSYGTNVAVLTISRFTDSSLGEWENNWDDAMEQIETINPSYLVIDLRNNPGGYFDAAVYAAEEFLAKDTLVSQQQDRNGNITDFSVSRNGNFLDIPVVILVNSGSASASEIFAGALQLNDRAVIIGQSTYGKGTAQSVIPYTDGSSLHITILKWLLPNGEWLNPDNPISPDIEVENTEESFLAGEDPQMDEAVEEVRN